MVLLKYQCVSIAMVILCQRLIFCLGKVTYVKFLLTQGKTNYSLDCFKFSKDHITHLEIQRNNAELGCDCDIQMYPDGILVLKNAQLDENNTPEHVNVTSFVGLTSDSRHLKMGVRTKPSGYIYIMHGGHTQYWHYNFTHQISFEGGLAFLNCTQTSIKDIKMLPRNDQENGNQVTPSSTSSQNGDSSPNKHLTISSQNGDELSEEDWTSSTKNGHRVSKTALPTTGQTEDPVIEKPYQGLPKIVIVGIILAVITILSIVIISVVLVKCCVRPKKKVLSAKKAQNGHDVADTVTGNDVTLTGPNGLMSKAQTTEHVEYADINPHSLVQRSYTDGEEKASVGASKGLVYADLAFNNKLTVSGKVPAVQQMHSLQISEDDISQLYAKPIKKNK